MKAERGDMEDHQRFILGGAYSLFRSQKPCSRPYKESKERRQYMEMRWNRAALRKGSSYHFLPPLASEDRKLTKVKPAPRDFILHSRNETRDLGFVLRSGCTVTGLSPESCKKLCEPLIEAGTDYKYLLEITSKEPTQPFRRTKKVYCLAVLKEVIQISKDTDQVAASEISLHRFMMELQPVVEILRNLTEVSMDILENSRSPLALLFEAISNVPCASRLDTTFLHLFRDCFQSFIGCLRTWLLHGQLLPDSGEDFFIGENSEFSRSQTRDFWKRGLVLRREFLPPFLTVSQAKEILSRGKAVRFMTLNNTHSYFATNAPLKTDAQFFTKLNSGEKINVPENKIFFAGSSNLKTAVDDESSSKIETQAGKKDELLIRLSTKTNEDTIDSLSLQNSIAQESSDLEFSASEPVKSQLDYVLHHTISRCSKPVAAGEYLWLKGDTKFHLETVRKIFLLENGDFTEYFTTNLFPIIAQAEKQKPSPGKLSVLIENAVRQLNITNEDWCTPSILLEPETYTKLMRESKSFGSLFDWLELDYKVPWPANLILTDSMLHEYKRVFRFFIGLHWVRWCLMDVLRWLSENAADLRPTGELHKLHLCCREMQHFVNFIQAYLSNQVIEGSWNELQVEVRKLQERNDLTIDELYAAHSRYVGGILIRCALNEKAEKLYKTLEGLLDLILRFRRNLISCDPLRGQVSQALDTHSAFRHTSMYFFKVLQILSSRGYEGGRFDDLLLRLNFNHFYSSSSV